MSKPEDICNNFGKNMLLFMLCESWSTVFMELEDMSHFNEGGRIEFMRFINELEADLLNLLFLRKKATRRWEEHFIIDFNEIELGQRFEHWFGVWLYIIKIKGWQLYRKIINIIAGGRGICAVLPADLSAFLRSIPFPSALSDCFPSPVPSIWESKFCSEGSHQRFCCRLS